MRLFAIVLLCLVLATCASHIPSARVTHPASAGLPGLQGFQLMPPEQAVDALPYRNRYPLINAELRQGLAAHGYHESATRNSASTTGWRYATHRWNSAPTFRPPPAWGLIWRSTVCATKPGHCACAWSTWRSAFSGKVW